MSLVMAATSDLSDPPSLASLAASGAVSLFLDFDGTLVELAPKPDAIIVPEGLGQGLSELARQLDNRCALVSGRSIAELKHYIGAAPLAYAGSHGAEMLDAGGALLRAQDHGLPSAIEEALKAFANEHDVAYEEKPHGGALHYRSAPEKAELVHGFAEELAAEHGWRAQSGKCVAELVSHGTSKGEAVLAFMQTHPFTGSRPIFLGDDLTDEAGFEACQSLGGIGIIVGERATNGAETMAQCALPDVPSVHDWLGL